MYELKVTESEKHSEGTYLSEFCFIVNNGNLCIYSEEFDENGVSYFTKIYFDLYNANKIAKFLKFAISQQD
jgi:hypothetical protein